MEIKYKLGTQFITRGKNPKLCTVIDIHKTYNYANELVKIRYVCVHTFMGQNITDQNVPQTTIDRSEIQK